MALSDNTELMRTLRPKITPDAAMRMFMQHVTGVSVTTATLGLVWWQTYFETCTAVLFPEGRK